MKNINRLFNSYHIFFPIAVLLLILNTFFNFYYIPRFWILFIFAALSSLSILINFIKKRKYNDYIDSINELNYHYKWPNFSIVNLLVAAYILYTYWIPYFDLAALILFVGIFLLVDTLVNFFQAYFYKNHKLSFTHDSIVNQQYNTTVIPYATIKSYEFDEEKIMISYGKRKLRINKNNFSNSNKMISEIIVFLESKLESDQ